MPQPQVNQLADPAQGRSAPSFVKWSKSRLVNTVRFANFCNGVALVTFAIVSFILPTGA